MLVPESSSPNNNMSSQYIQPDYLSPLPTTLDAKRSPLALLAQTCSQIGADPTPQSASAASAPSTTTTVTVGTNSSTAINHHQSGNNNKNPDSSSSAKSKRSSDPEKSSKTPPAKHHPYDFVPAKEDAAIITVNKEHHKTGFKSPKSVNSSAGSPPSSSAVLPTPSPIVEPPRSYDPLAGYRPAPMFPGLYNPYDALGAFRHPAYSHLGYPPSLGLSLAGYQQALAQSSYAAAAATAAAAAARKPDQVCRDPYCTGCPASSTPSSTPTTTATSTTSPSVSAASSCPAGCNQCVDHLQNKTSVSSIQTSTSSLSSTTTPSTTSSSRPYVCNWIAADNYCGKRFTSSEELLQHLRTHTSLAAESSPATSSYSPLQLQPPSHLLASSALHRSAYPTPPLSPLSMAARYHPYAAAAKPPTAAVGSPGAVPPPPPNPLLTLHHPYAHHPGLSAYYGHPYASLYSQRMLGSGVLP